MQHVHNKSPGLHEVVGDSVDPPAGECWLGGSGRIFGAHMLVLLPVYILFSPPLLLPNVVFDYILIS